MVNKVYTPAEVAELFRVSERDVLRMIEAHELEAFLILGQHVRIREEAVVEAMNRPYCGSPASEKDNSSAKLSDGGKSTMRRRDLRGEREARDNIWAKIKKIAPDLLGLSRKYFTVNGKRGVLAVSMTVSGPRGYWFGVNEKKIDTGAPTLIVAVLGDRQDAFVIPYAEHRAVFDGLSRSNGEMKFYIEEKSGEFYLTGKGVSQPVLLTRYKNSFSLFR